jgi:hypothetical protein
MGGARWSAGFGFLTSFRDPAPRSASTAVLLLGLPSSAVFGEWHINSQPIAETTHALTATKSLRSNVSGIPERLLSEVEVDDGLPERVELIPRRTPGDRFACEGQSTNYGR